MSSTEDVSGAAPIPDIDTPSTVAQPPSSSLLQRFDRLWDWVRRWLTALWIARASTASVVLGAILFTVPAAVRDILRALAQDLTPEGLWVGADWRRLGAFFAGSFFWAMAVHYAARVLLWFDLGMLPEAPEKRAQFKTMFDWAPRGLGIAAISTVLLGLFLTWLWPGAEPLTEETGPLFALMALTVVEIVLFILYTRWRLWLLNLPAALASVAARGARAVGLVGPANAERVENPTKSVDDAKAGSSPRAGWVQWKVPPAGGQRDVQPFFVPSAVRNRGRSPADGVQPIWSVPSEVWPQLLGISALLLGVGFGAMAWAIVNPLSMAGFATQSGILFLILATWIPFFSVLVFIEHWRRFPVVLPLLLVAAIANCASSYDRHALRLASNSIAESAANADQRLSTLDAALDRWGVANQAKADNAKANNAVKAPAPPLIILATAGGGSRAAYWTATALGALQDADPDFRSRLFAVSAVSGGALGAAIFDALLFHQDRPAGSASTFCRDGDFKEVGRDHPQRYQRCGEVVAAGDFLAPPIAALGYQDAISWLVPLPLGTDRATAIELSWEAAWRWSAQRDLGDDEGIFAQPFSGLAPKASGPWRPLLFFNGTSVATGKRIVASQVALLAADQQPLLRDAYDVLDLLPPEAAGKLRLSTAVGVAARFPYVLPAGSLSGGKGCEARVCDRVVDGGYFENFGAATAEELLVRIRALSQAPDDRPGVWRRADGTAFRPVVVQISSDPTLRPDLSVPEIPENVQSRLWAEVSAPPAALYATESARGVLAMQLLKRRAEQEYQAPFVHLALRDDRTPVVPLSWSLSRAAQRDIEKLLCDGYNQRQLRKLAAAIGRDDLTASVCGNEAP